MDKNYSSDRRTFLKMTAASTAMLAVSRVDDIFATPAAWTDRMPINPAIPNTRVVCCFDTKMLKSNPTSNTFASQNAAVDAALVQTNMDQMAMRLAGKTAADEAWKTIFRSSKLWSDTKVAIKVNCEVAVHMPRAAVVQKLTKVLTGFGVQPSNIVLFDGGGNASGNDKYTSYCSLTDTSKILAVVSNLYDGLNGRVPITNIPNVTGISCAADLVNNVTDILINVAVNKTHNTKFEGSTGRCTLSLKNHFGTFTNTVHDPVIQNKNTYGAEQLHCRVNVATDPGTTDGIIGINKHAAIIGGNPVRQQLCIVDSLMASEAGPGSPPDKRVDRIIMGTFGPVVDYLTVKKVREQVEGLTHNNAVIAQYLTAFGYAETDALEWIEFTPGVNLADPLSREYSGRVVKVTLSHPSYKRVAMQFTIPHSADAIQLRIVDGRGRLTRTLWASPEETMIVWDGKSNNGATVSVGNYLVEIAAGSMKRTGSIVVSR